MHNFLLFNVTFISVRIYYTKKENVCLLCLCVNCLLLKKKNYSANTLWPLRDMRYLWKGLLCVQSTVKNKNTPALIGGPQTQIREQFFF